MVEPDALPLVEPPRRVYRLHVSVAGGADVAPWRFAHAAADGGVNFGGRFDDPHPRVDEGRYRVLALCSDPVGACLEIFQSLRPDPAYLELAGSLSGGQPSRPAIDASDIVKRSLSTVTLEPGTQPRFAPITDSRWRAYLEDALGVDLARAGIGTLKTGEYLGIDLTIAQAISEHVHDHFPTIAGLVTPSTLGHDHENFFVFAEGEGPALLRRSAQALATHELSIATLPLQIALEQLSVDVALDADRMLRVNPLAGGVNLARLDVYQAPAAVDVRLREDTNAVSETLRVMGRTADATRVTGLASSGEIVLVSRHAFQDVPTIGDLVTVSSETGADRARVVEHQYSIDFDR